MITALSRAIEGEMLPVKWHIMQASSLFTGHADDFSPSKTRQGREHSAD